MSYKNNSYHIVTTLIFNLLMLAVVFSTDNPLILLGIMMTCLSVFVWSNNIGKLKKGLAFFVPFSLVTVVINFIFVSEGNIKLFYVLGKNFTLEALLYAVLLSFKLLIVIYIFMLLDIMIDSDKAVSYFSAIMPKSTLTLMIAFKFFPAMRERLKNLKEIYSLRGVDFEAGSLKNKVKSYIPVLSILLETSLEGAFDIGEASYVRGFLSSKRTVYDRQSFKIGDCLVAASTLIFLFVFIFVKIMNMDSFNIYARINIYGFINKGSVFSFITAIVMAVAVFFFSRV